MSPDTDLTEPPPAHGSVTGRAPATPTPPRPVTPVGLASALLDAGLARMRAGQPVDAGALADLARAREIVGGLERYVAQATVAPSPALEALEDRTRRETWGAGLEQEMLSGQVEGAFLAGLVRWTRATRVLEIGSFTGYASLAMAEALPSHGRVVALEVDPHAASVAQQCLAGSPAGDRVRLRIGPALDSLASLDAEGEQFDVVFLDADKAGYTAYLDALLAGGLLAPGAVVAVDNTLLQGEPWSTGPLSANGVAVAAFNARVTADPRLSQVLVPLRDGLTLLHRVDR